MKLLDYKPDKVLTYGQWRPQVGDLVDTAETHRDLLVLGWLGDWAYCFDWRGSRYIHLSAIRPGQKATARINPEWASAPYEIDFGL